MSFAARGVKRRRALRVVAPIAGLLALALAGCGPGPSTQARTASTTNSYATAPATTGSFTSGPPTTDLPSTGLPGTGLPTTSSPVTYSSAPGSATTSPGPIYAHVPAPPSSTPASNPTTTPATSGGTNGATPAPSWLGTRTLKSSSSRNTPPELLNRRIITTDLLPPPADGKFHATISTVPLAVLDRSTWSALCPVSVDQLRYLNVSFRGFDGRAHTGELLVNRSAASKIVTVFRKLFQANWPIEQMRVVTEADFYAPATGDGNNTSAFACRPVTGTKTTWSLHAYGLAVDVNPFHNPYISGRTLVPQLAKAYLNRHRGLPGMNTATSVPVRAFRSIGWGWGGNYHSKKDYMHFSSTGG